MRIRLSCEGRNPDIGFLGSRHIGGIVSAILSTGLEAGLRRKISHHFAYASPPLPVRHEGLPRQACPGKKVLLSVYVPRPPCEQGEAGGCVCLWLTKIQGEGSGFSGSEIYGMVKGSVSMTAFNFSRSMSKETTTFSEED